MGALSKDDEWRLGCVALACFVIGFAAVALVIAVLYALAQWVLP